MLFDLKNYNNYMLFFYFITPLSFFFFLQSDLKALTSFLSKIIWNWKIQ